MYTALVGAEAVHGFRISSVAIDASVTSVQNARALIERVVIAVIAFDEINDDEEKRDGFREYYESGFCSAFSKGRDWVERRTGSAFNGEGSYGEKKIPSA